MVAREQEVLEREHRAVEQAQPDPALALHRHQVLHDPVGIELPVVHAGEERVALQVVHPVRVQLARHHLAQHRQEVAAAAPVRIRPRRRLAADQPRHVRGLDAAAGEAAANLRGQTGVEHQLERVVLMVGAAFRGLAHPGRNAQVREARHDAFGRVRERRVPEVVEEDGEAQRLAEAVAVVRIQLELRRERVEHPGGHGHGAEAVRVAGVGGAGKGQVREPQLLHVAQPLVLRAVHQRPLVRRDGDGAVDGIADVHRHEDTLDESGRRAGPARRGTRNRGLRFPLRGATRRPAAPGSGPSGRCGRRNPRAGW